MSGTARSKEDAKEEAARQLAAAGVTVPPPYNAPGPDPPGAGIGDGAAPCDIRSYKALLKEEAREDAARGPDKAQRVSEHHLSLLQHLDKEQVNRGAKAVDAATPETDPEKSLTAVLESMGLKEEWHELPAQNGALTLVKLTPTTPPLVFCARSRADAAANALSYLRDVMNFREH